MRANGRKSIIIKYQQKQNHQQLNLLLAYRPSLELEDENTVQVYCIKKILCGEFEPQSFYFLNDQLIFKNQVLREYDSERKTNSTVVLKI